MNITCQICHILDPCKLTKIIHDMARGPEFSEWDPRLLREKEHIPVEVSHRDNKFWGKRRGKLETVLVNNCSVLVEG